MSDMEETEVFRMEEESRRHREAMVSPASSFTMPYDLRSRRNLDLGMRPELQAIRGRGSEENFNCSNGADGDDVSEK